MILASHWKLIFYVEEKERLKFVEKEANIVKEEAKNSRVICCPGYLQDLTILN